MTRQTHNPRHFNFTTFQVMAAIGVLVAAIAVPRLLSRARANPTDSTDRPAIAAAFGDIRDAEVAYQARNGEYADLLNLRNSGFLGERIAGVDQLKFRFSVQADDGSHYCITASPLIAVPGAHFYYTDEAGITFESSSAIAAPIGDSSGQAPEGFVPLRS